MSFLQVFWLCFAGTLGVAGATGVIWVAFTMLVGILEERERQKQLRANEAIMAKFLTAKPPTPARRGHERR